MGSCSIILHHAPQTNRHSGIFLALPDSCFSKPVASVPASSFKASLCSGSTRPCEGPCPLCHWSSGCPPLPAGAATLPSARGAVGAKAHEQNKSHRQSLNVTSCLVALVLGANPKIRQQLGTTVFQRPGAWHCSGRGVCRVQPAASLG